MLDTHQEQGWAIQGFGQVDMTPIKALFQYSVRYVTDTILQTSFPPDMILIQYLRPIPTRYETDTIIGTNFPRKEDERCEQKTQTLGNSNFKIC